MADLIQTKSFRLRTQGPQPVEQFGPDGFLLQTFGVEEVATDTFCATTELKGTENMQLFKEVSSNHLSSNLPAGNPNAGPFRSVSYQARRIIIPGSPTKIVFNGSEVHSSVYCDNEDAITGDEASCDEEIIL